MGDGLLFRQSAIGEARALLPLLENGSTVEEIEALISVQPNIENRPRKFAAVHPEEQPMIEQALKFRAAVLEAFEKLVREGAAADLEETEETESEEMVLLA